MPNPISPNPAAPTNGSSETPAAVPPSNSSSGAAVGPAGNGSTGAPVIPAAGNISGGIAAPVPAPAPTLEDQLNAFTTEKADLAKQITDVTTQQQSVDSDISNLTGLIGQKTSTLADFDSKIADFQKSSATLATFINDNLAIAQAAVGARQADIDSVVTAFDKGVSTLQQTTLPGLKATADASQAAATAAAAVQTSSAATTAAVAAQANLTSQTSAMTDLQNQITAAHAAGNTAGKYSMYFLLKELQTTLTQTTADRAVLEQALEKAMQDQVTQQKTVADAQVKAAADQEAYTAQVANLSDLTTNRRAKILAQLADLAKPAPVTPPPVAPPSSNTGSGAST